MPKYFVYTFSILLFAPRVFAMSYPEAAGFETSMEAVGQVLSSPALPSLDNEGFSIAPLYGVVKIEGVAENASLEDGTPLTIENSGAVDGQIAGLTINYSGQGDLGFFAIAAGSRVHGDMKSYTPKYDQTTDVRDIVAQSTIAAAGLTYRLIGDAKSGFALGVFGGPAMIMSQTAAQIYHTQGTTKVTLNPSLNALYFGLQFTVRLGEFRVNPYLNILGNTDPQCEHPTYSGNDYPINQYNKCINGEHGITTFAVVAGSGINIGYGRFGFGVAQSGGTGSQAMKSKPLVFSFRISI